MEHLARDCMERSVANSVHFHTPPAGLSQWLVWPLSGRNVPAFLRTSYAISTQAFMPHCFNRCTLLLPITVRRSSMLTPALTHTNTPYTHTHTHAHIHSTHTPSSVFSHECIRLFSQSCTDALIPHLN